jgi:hypothetical protein
VPLVAVLLGLVELVLFPGWGVGPVLLVLFVPFTGGLVPLGP